MWLVDIESHRWATFKKRILWPRFIKRNVPAYGGFNGDRKPPNRTESWVGVSNVIGVSLEGCRSCGGFFMKSSHMLQEAFCVVTIIEVRKHRWPQQLSEEAVHTTIHKLAPHGSHFSLNEPQGLKRTNGYIPLQSGLACPKGTFNHGPISLQVIDRCYNMFTARCLKQIGKRLRRIVVYGQWSPKLATKYT